MATVFETRLIGNIGKDAVIKNMEKGVIAINFKVAHNKNWKDKRSGENKSKTTWVFCTIWKKEGSNLRIADFLKQGSLVEVLGTPFAKGFILEDETIRAEIRINVTHVNILRSNKIGETDEIYNESKSENGHQNMNDLNNDNFDFNDSDGNGNDF